ncbi:hypothetical protein EON81_13635 [bacterium]|nr:MAG: hypothetical protein EON81_13635 [bacterium]
MRRASILLPLLLVGCSRTERLMPLEEGRSWTYSIRAGFEVAVEQVKVVRPISVAGAAGMELVGPLGISRMAWKDGVLYASQSAGARFTPALPIFVPPGRTVTYHGRMETARGRVPTSGTIKSVEGQTVNLGAREFSTTRTTVVLKAGEDGIELITWFAAGVGIVQQEQRTNNVLDLQLQLTG